MATMKIEYTPPDKCIPYEANARKIDDRAVEAVAHSISSFGFRSPVLLDENRVIIAGHTRVKAALKLGLKTVPVITCSDLTDEQVRAYRLADNRAGEFTTWDLDLLNKELETITMDFAPLDFDAVFAALPTFDVESNAAPARAAEWAGMPEYSAPDARPFRQVIVSFLTPEAIEDFKQKIGQDFSENARSIEHPKRVTQSSVDHVWVDPKHTDGSP